MSAEGGRGGGPATARAILIAVLGVVALGFVAWILTRIARSPASERQLLALAIAGGVVLLVVAASLKRRGGRGR